MSTIFMEPEVNLKRSEGLGIYTSEALRTLISKYQLLENYVQYLTTPQIFTVHFYISYFLLQRYQ